MNSYALHHKMAGFDGSPTPSLAGPPGPVRKSYLWLDFAKDLGIGIVSGVITTGLTALMWKFFISKLINYCVGEREIPDAPPRPNPTPADCVGDIKGEFEPAIPYAAPPPNPPLSLLTLWRSITVVPTNNFIARLINYCVGEREIPDAPPRPNPTPADCVGDIKGEPAIPYAAPLPNPPLSLLTLWRSITVVPTNNFIARLSQRAAAAPAAPLENDRELSIVWPAGN